MPNKQEMQLLKT